MECAILIVFKPQSFIQSSFLGVRPSAADN